MSQSLIFKHVWRGWFVGASVVFTPLFLLATIVNPDMPGNMAFAIPMIPLVAALQGVIIGGIVVVGLKIWRPKDL